MKRQPIIEDVDTEDYIPVSMVAKRKRVHIASVYRAIANSELRAFRLGGTLHVLADDMNDWCPGQVGRPPQE